jgi:hypothetical protein
MNCWSLTSIWKLNLNNSEWKIKRGTVAVGWAHSSCQTHLAFRPMGNEIGDFSPLAMLAISRPVEVRSAVGRFHGDQIGGGWTEGHSPWRPSNSEELGGEVDDDGGTEGGRWQCRELGCPSPLAGGSSWKAVLDEEGEGGGGPLGQLGRWWEGATVAGDGGPNDGGSGCKSTESDGVREWNGVGFLLLCPCLW